MFIVCIESPFKPSEDDIKKYADRYSPAELLRQNLTYARLALRDSLRRGEAPFASHLLYTQVWSETDELRENGIKAGIEFHHRVDTVALYVDLGVSGGMRLAGDNASLIGVDQTRRLILNSGKLDPRDLLAAQNDDCTFPFLDELRREETKTSYTMKVNPGVHGSKR